MTSSPGSDPSPEDDFVIDPVSIQVRDVAASAAFYDAILAPLGASRRLDFGEVMGFGPSRPSFWIGPVTTAGGAREVHLAFLAADRATVDAFHAAAVAAGAERPHPPRGWPGERPGEYAGVRG